MGRHFWQHTVICTPSREYVQATFAYDLAEMIRDEKDLSFSIAQGSILPNLRTSLVVAALGGGTSHILFIDSDMRFPINLHRRLKQHGKDIVGVNAMMRGGGQTAEFSGSLQDHGLQEVDSIGMGIVLISTEVFKKMAQPWFAMPFDGTKYIGEDRFFCHKAKEAGFKIYVDHDLSKEIKHTGSTEYGTV